MELSASNGLKILLVIWASNTSFSDLLLRLVDSGLEWGLDSLTPKNYTTSQVTKVATVASNTLALITIKIRHGQILMVYFAVIPSFPFCVK
ncbi:hypothetical protein [Desulfosporosinus nitroreducens]|uniref:Uncharacterized protein n=1 Tax=Desulfosporosinus nitroreducens TaxID=2018668 RepID=A0ABT8QVE3_9FIRM|nr:hypothetical protein [Desulfosporosinus nitroreducens]MCO1603854.1 hypothetical protein [Desulfosporosinus nitroreducens]MDO0825323.1 hypothetical protein [Desulfosporosinus nitroreducens]